MGRSRSVETYVEVDVDLDDFSDEELIEELEDRKVSFRSVSLSREEAYFLRDLLDKFRAANQKSPSSISLYELDDKLGELTIN